MMLLASGTLWGLLACGLGLYLFASGFLLSRRELAMSTERRGDDPPALYGGAVILLVDALSFDFLDPQRRPEEGAWAGNMEHVRRALQRRGGESRLFHFRADPPTTTLQRLKGLTTGSFPTFIDASRNFGGSFVTEDTWIAQLARANRSIFFAGDDTWLSLFPRAAFSKAFPFPSFDVMDLDSVDRGVRKHLLEELSLDSKWPDIAIGHLLGVDHCGHRFGPLHPEMRRKLLEANQLLGELLQRLPPDRLLLLFGDHGMTPTGDHGGDSTAELDAGLFVVAPRGMTGGGSDEFASLEQVDLVPTLATLLGLPIPFSSLGRLSPAFFPNGTAAARALRANLQQVGRYLHSYQAAFGDLPSGALSAFLAEQQRLLGAEDPEAALRWMREVQAFFRAKWTRFELDAIAAGLLLLLLAVAHLYCPALGWPSGLALAFAALPALCGLPPSLALPPLLLPGLWLLRHLWRHPAARALIRVPLLAPLAASGGLLFSNSFVVHEAAALQFLLQTALFGALLTALWRHSPAANPRALVGAFLCAAALLRLSLLFGACREEQGASCEMGVFVQPIEKLPPSALRLRSWRFVAAAAGLGLCLALHRLWLRRRGHLEGYRPAVLVAGLLLPLSGAAVAAAVFLQCLPPARRARVPPPLLLLPARAALALPTVGLCVMLLRPMLIFLSRSDPEDALAYDPSGPRVPGVVPLLWRHLKRQLAPGAGQRSVWGLPSLFSAAFSVAFLFCAIPCLMLLGDGFLFNLLGLFGTVAAVASVLRHVGLPAEEDRDLAAAVFLALLAQLFFYGFGHQPLLSHIPWHAAFVGFRGHHTGYLLPAVLVLLSLFCSFLLTGLLLPLTLVIELSGGGQWLPCLWTTNVADNPRGELAIVDNEAAFMGRLRQRYRLFLFCSMCLVLASLAAAALHRRHLMVWKIFAPRMMFGTVSLSGALFGCGLGYLLALRLCQSVRTWQADLGASS